MKIKGIITKICNVRPDKNQRWILLSQGLSSLLFTYSQPMLLKTVISELPPQWLAFESMMISFFALLIGMLWQGKIREYGINMFSKIAITESTLGFLLGMYLCFVRFDVWIFAICSLIYTSFIALFVGKCMMYFRSKLWTEKSREVYDNNVEIVGGFVCMLGYFVALFIMPSIKTAIFLFGLCCILDDIGWIIVYYRNRKILKIHK